MSTKDVINFGTMNYILDKIRLGTQYEFYLRSKKLTQEDINKANYLFGDLQNAFQHGYGAALLTYYFGEDIARWFGYFKETISEKEEKASNGITNAFLDTNRDLWNNETGIRYALEGKKQGKAMKEIADDIFNNITKQNSDFIVSFLTDTRRWNNSSNEDNLWKIINKEHKSLSNKSEKVINNVKKFINKTEFKSRGGSTDYKSNASNKKSSIKVDFNNVSVNGKKYKDWSAKEQKAFWDGFESNSLNTNKDTKLKENIIKENKGKIGKINISGSSHFLEILNCSLA